MNEVYLLTGSNLGNRLAYLEEALLLIEQLAGAIVRKSSVYETAAWGFTAQPSFYNQALEVTTALSPEELMRTALSIESRMGRERTEKMGPRVIDIDVLLFNQAVIRTNPITVPHPRLTERRFALTPLAEIVPELMHPVENKTIRELLRLCTDPLDVYKI